MDHRAIRCGSIHHDGAGAVFALCLQLQADCESNQEFTLIQHLSAQLHFSWQAQRRYKSSYFAAYTEHKKCRL
jgi:histidinol phosphatase-like PHP family hydrolase